MEFQIFDLLIRTPTKGNVAWRENDIFYIWPSFPDKEIANVINALPQVIAKFQMRFT